MPDEPRRQLVRDFAAMLIATPLVVLVTLPLSDGLGPTILRAIIAFAGFTAAIYIGRRITAR